MMQAAFVRDKKLSIISLAEPNPGENEVLVKAAASSLNQGEVRAIRSAPHWALAKGPDFGWVPGWDFAGVVIAAAASGVGPRPGARVAGWVRQGAWAEQLAAPVDQLVELPDDVGFEQAASIPIAGLTAWHALRVGGLAAGKSVLVTGAAGGVGRFALQIAAAAGAIATAVVGSAARAASIAHLTDQVMIGLPDEGKYDIVLECIGGSSLAGALALLAPYGAVVSYGNASGEMTCFEAGAAFRKPCISLHSFALYDELERRGSNTEGLDELIKMLSAKRLQTDIALKTPLHQVEAACEALMQRTVDGKAVLLIG